ncbi:MAG: TetR/AcrR family transcriptional regulator C-terminal domain-containing protein [Caulobacter sp.]|nr:TetR/AcrR family transcriptional regulator C-terminal domain-containing protein [Caulobacter sp.]
MALTRADIVSAALALLDEVGLDGLSTRRLAERLGVRGPSLYWHVKTMAELRDHMAEAILAEAMGRADAASFDGGWREWLAAGARGYRRAALSRRDGARLLSMARPTGARSDLSYPAMVQRLRTAGFSASDAHDSMMALGRYVLGWVLFEQASDDLDREHGFEFGLQAMLSGLDLRVAASAA